MIYILGIDLFDCMKDIYTRYLKSSENKEGYMRYDFGNLTNAFNEYIGETFECEEVKSKAVELAELGFIYLYIDALDGNDFFLKIDR